MNVAELKPQGVVDLAIRKIGKKFGQIPEVSRFFETPAFPAGNGPNFVNAVGSINTQETPVKVLQLFHQIEADLRRIRNDRWGPRTIDIDLLGISDVVSPNVATYEKWRDLPLSRQKSDSPDELILPHPRLHERSFVLVPMAEVAPDWMHPVLGLTVRQMLERLPADERATVRPI